MVLAVRHAAWPPRSSWPTTSSGSTKIRRCPRRRRGHLRIFVEPDEVVGHELRGGHAAWRTANTIHHAVEMAPVGPVDEGDGAAEEPEAVFVEVVGSPL